MFMWLFRDRVISDFNNMAAKNLIMRKSLEKDRVLRNSKGQILQKCPIFNVQYLGKMPARGEYGREYIAEPVEALMKLKDRQKSPKRSALQITEKGFHFLDFNGAFGKEKHVLIPIHHICYGVADEQNPKVFAIITRTDSNPENSLFECHAFHCDKKKEASEITYWLLRTFLEVFEDLQRRRRVRQERKLLRQQSLVGNTAGPAFDRSPPTSPTETMSASDLTMYSVILDGSKSKGAAVRLARNHSKSRPVSFPPGVPLEAAAGAPPTHPGIAGAPPTHPGIAAAREVYNAAGPGMPYAAPPPGHRKIPENGDHQGRPLQPEYPFVRHYDPRAVMPTPGEIPQYPQSLQRPPKLVNIAHGDPHQHPDTLNPPSVPRYSKNPALPRSRSSTGNTSSTDETNSTLFSDSFSGVSREEADFLFIEMLQEEFGGLDVAPAGKVANISGRRSSKNAKNGPPDQKLRSEDIEKRVREWLEYEEGDGAVFSPMSPRPGRNSPATMRSPAGYNPGYIYQSGGYRDTRSHGKGARTVSQSSVASEKDYF